jgi:hypothetical protein
MRGKSILRVVVGLMLVGVGLGGQVCAQNARARQFLQDAVYQLQKGADPQLYCGTACLIAASELADHALAVEPNYAEAYLIKGISEVLRGLKPLAVLNLTRAFELKPALAADPNVKELLDYYNVAVPLPPRRPAVSAHTATPPQRAQATSRTGGTSAEVCREAQRKYEQCVADAREMSSTTIKISTLGVCRGFLDLCR